MVFMARHSFFFFSVLLFCLLPLFARASLPSTIAQELVDPPPAIDMTIEYHWPDFLTRERPLRLSLGFGGGFYIPPPSTSINTPDGEETFFLQTNPLYTFAFGIDYAFRPAHHFSLTYIYASAYTAPIIQTIQTQFNASLRPQALVLGYDFYLNPTLVLGAFAGIDFYTIRYYTAKGIIIDEPINQTTHGVSYAFGARVEFFPVYRLGVSVNYALYTYRGAPLVLQGAPTDIVNTGMRAFSTLFFMLRFLV